MTNLEKLEEIIKTLELAKRDAEKSDNGNSAASIRLRKDAMQGKRALDELRQLVLENRDNKEKE